MIGVFACLKRFGVEMQGETEGAPECREGTLGSIRFSGFERHVMCFSGRWPACLARTTAFADDTHAISPYGDSHSRCIEDAIDAVTFSGEDAA